MAGYYQTILGRAADTAGMQYWSGESARVVALGADVREVFFALAMGFFSSPEYLARNTSDTQYLTDLYRTFFGRDPDSAGFTFWLGKIRKAQCQGGNAVSTAVSNLAGIFFTSAEYVQRSRNDREYVGDVYNAFLRRGPGGDSAGFNYWVGQIAGLTRTGVRNQFIPTTEFQNRVAAVLSAGCLP